MRTRSPEPEVLRRARRGDEDAFGAVVACCGALVLNLAWRMVRDRQEAEDLSQEVFLRLYRVFDRYDPDRPFLPWLKAMATNLVINLTSAKKHRIRRRSASLDRLREEAGLVPGDAAAEGGGEAAERRERATLLRDAIRGLRPEYREVIALRYFRGLPLDEIARELALPSGTVKNRLFRARGELADALGPEAP